MATIENMKLAEARVERKYKREKEELEDIEHQLKTDYAVKSTINSSLAVDMKESVRHLFQDGNI